MARRQQRFEEPLPANLSAQQIKAAIPKVERRLKELEAVEISGWSEELREELDALHLKIDGTLTDVFGHDTIEHRRFNVNKFSRYVPVVFGDVPPREKMEGYDKAVRNGTTLVRTALEFLKEKLSDMGEAPGGRALQAIDGLDLHSEIERAAGALYRDGYYANAVEGACKALRDLVRLRSGVGDKDGTKLMEHVFSPKKPVLRFNQLANQSDEDEQRGFMMLFSGAVTGLRNPRSHEFIHDDPERALEFIGFLSLLAKLLDDAEKVRA